jgi:CRP/FNR family transcriptional regulator, cyclic AMP receptor protein
MAVEKRDKKRVKSRKPDKAPPPSLDPHTVVPLVSGSGSALKLAARGVVFTQGDKSDAVFYIETGRIQISVVSDQGKEAIIAMFGPGDFFGEGCLTGQTVRLASAVAMIAADLVKIEKNAMVRLLTERPTFSAKFTEFLVARNIQVEADIVDQLFNSSEKRLARLLLLLANFNNDGELRPIVPKISQEVLASRVGTTRSRINSFMNKFRKLGLIEYNGHIKVHTALLNVIVHD